MKEHWTQQVSWEPTSLPSVWKCVESGMFHFSDETFQLDSTPYNSRDECDEGLLRYCKEFLGC